jgi:hypothetical protein
VRTASEKTLTAWVYSVVQKNDFISPTREYMNIIKNAAQEFRFPEAYRSYLETMETR